MAIDDSAWLIYLVFFMIPLARIIPRLIRRARGQAPLQPGSARGSGQITAEPRKPEPRRPRQAEPRQGRGTQSPDRMVLGQMSLGVRDFASMRENLGMDAAQLESVLDGLEKKGLMRVVKKSGLLGSKVELHITEEGIRRYHS